jgi:hypothetical protein
MSPPDYGAGISAATMPHSKIRTTSLTCLLVAAAVCLNMYK